MSYPFPFLVVMIVMVLANALVTKSLVLNKGAFRRKLFCYFLKLDDNLLLHHALCSVLTFLAAISTLSLSRS